MSVFVNFSYRKLFSFQISFYMLYFAPKRLALQYSHASFCFCSVLISSCLSPKLKIELYLLFQNFFYFFYIIQHNRIIFNIYFQKTGMIQSNKSNSAQIYFSCKAKTYSCSMYFGFSLYCTDLITECSSSSIILVSVSFYIFTCSYFIMLFLYFLYPFPF